MTRSLTKLKRIRGENCIEASVSVIRRMAKTIDTTVMIERGDRARMIWATCGSAREGNRKTGTQALSAGTVSSSDESMAPRARARWRSAAAVPEIRRAAAYMAMRSSGSNRLVTTWPLSDLNVKLPDWTGVHKAPVGAALSRSLEGRGGSVRQE